MASNQAIYLPGDLGSKPKMPHNHVRMNSANFSDATPSSSLESTDLNWGQFANPNPRRHPQDSYKLYRPQAQDSYGYQIPQNYQNQNLQNQENGFPNYENGFQNNKMGFQPQENGFQNQGNLFQKPENNFQNQENQFQNQDNRFQNQENVFQNQENGFQNQGNRFQNQETHFPNQENGFLNQENAFQNRENHSQPRENSFQNPSNDFQSQNGSFSINMEANNNPQRNQNQSETVNTQFPMDNDQSDNPMNQANLLSLAIKTHLANSKLDSTPSPPKRQVTMKKCPEGDYDHDHEERCVAYVPTHWPVYEIPVFSPPPVGTFEESVKHWQNNKVVKLRNIWRK